MAIYELSFSPTGGTRRVAQIITRAWMAGEENGEDKAQDTVYTIDLTLPEAQAQAAYGEIPAITKQDLCIVAVPSYKGRVPGIALQRLASRQANGAPTIEVVAYGNREYEDTLLELQDHLLENGYRPIGAICAVTEHSMLRSVAAGRPDAQDCLQLQDFVKRIREKVDDPATSPIRIPSGPILNDPILSVPGNRPYKTMPAEPCSICADDTCTQCGICSSACPVEAIPATDPRVTEATCIGCMRCVDRCPIRARHLTPKKQQFIQELLGRFASQRKENQLFL